MLKNILVAVDGSVQSIRALDGAVQMARASGGHLTVMTAVVVPWTRDAEAANMRRIFADEDADARALLDDSLGHVAAPSDTETLVGWGSSVAEAVVDQADEGGHDLVVLGSRGLGPVRATLLGSVARGVVELSRVPVLAVRPGAARGGSSPPRLVVGVDGSSDGADALRWAAGLAAVIGAEVVALHVAEIPAYPQQVPSGDAGHPVVALAVLEGIQARLDGEWTQPLRDAAVGYRTRLEEAGDAGAAIVHVADEEAADVVVVGRRGHRALRELLLGSVSNQVLEHARHAVAVVPSREPARRPEDARVGAEPQHASNV